MHAFLSQFLVGTSTVVITHSPRGEYICKRRPVACSGSTSHSAVWAFSMHVRAFAVQQSAEAWVMAAVDVRAPSRSRAQQKCCCGTIRASKRVCKTPTDTGCLLDPGGYSSSAAERARQRQQQQRQQHAYKASSRCAKPDWHGAIVRELIPLSEFNCSERYFDSLHCNGYSFLFSRRDVPTPRPGDPAGDDEHSAVLSADAAYSLLDCASACLMLRHLCHAVLLNVFPFPCPH